jgi:hypothetical protein
MSINAKTARLLGSLEASTTEADIAAFIERTEVNLDFRGEHSYMKSAGYIPFPV